VQTYFCSSSKNERLPVLCQLTTAGTYNSYDGVQKKTITEQAYKKLKNNKDILVIPYDKSRSKTKNGDLVSEREHYIKKSDALKQATHGKINLYKTAGDVQTGIKLWRDLQPQISGGDKITQVEAEYIMGCKSSGITYAQRDWEGDGFHFDLNSAYAHILSSCKNFPLKEGVLERITEDLNSVKFIKFGLYKCVVHPSEDSKINSLFHSFSAFNYYTHIDLQNARLLGLKIEHITSDTSSSNFCSYPPDTRVRFDFYFKNFVDYLYEIRKTADVKKDNFLKSCAKDILTPLYGFLCMARKRVNIATEVFEDDSDDDQYDGVPRKIVGITESNNGDLLIKNIKMDCAFVTNYARMKPFISAFIRQRIIQTIFPHIDKIVQINTDGFISTENIIKSHEIGRDIGMYKCESGYFYIKHVKFTRKWVELSQTWEKC
jgi:hypothetical protein